MRPNQMVVIPHAVEGEPTDSKRCIQCNGFRIRTAKFPISSQPELERLVDSLKAETGLHVHPDMYFGHNGMWLEYDQVAYSPEPPTKSDEEPVTYDPLITFVADEALRMVKTENPEYKISAADEWTCRDVEELDVPKPYDWTFATSYAGSLHPSLRRVKTCSTIPFDSLRKPEPILFFDDIILYEDELADNGVARLGLKVRVMPSGFLILLRHFLRIDQVVFALRETRLYHRFVNAANPGSNDAPRGKLLVQTTSSRVNYDALKEYAVKTTLEQDVSPYLLDENWIGAQLLVTSKDEHCKIPQAEVLAFETQEVIL